MFRPIRLKGTNLGVQICHDMFYGLIGHRLRPNGAQLLIDLTYGNVNLVKWRNVVRARSLEAADVFLCTMGYNPDNHGSAAALAYQAGRKLPAVVDTTGASGAGGYAVFALGNEPPGKAVADDGQAYSPQEYDDPIARLRPAG